MEDQKELTVEYLVSKCLLKKLFKDGLITDEELNKIDEENMKTFNKQSF